MRLFEPWHGAFFVLLFYFQVGDAADAAWSGGVPFTRDALTVPVPTLAAELRTVMSDDYLLTNRLPSIHPVRSMVTHVVVPGDAEAVRHRLVRVGRIIGRNGGRDGGFLTSTVLAGAGVLCPIVLLPSLAVEFAALYRRPYLDGMNSVFAYRGALLSPAATLAAMFTREFEWDDRRSPDAGAVVLNTRHGSDGR